MTEIGAIRILRWIVFAFRPLTIQELTEALLITDDEDGNTYPSDGLPDAYDEYYVNDKIRKLCGPLVSFQKGEPEKPLQSQTVHFVHSSIQEYLTKHVKPSQSDLRPFCFSNTVDEHDRLARLCLRYLCFDEFGNDSQPSEKDWREKVDRYPFLGYAAQSWYNHAAQG